MLHDMQKLSTAADCGEITTSLSWLIILFSLAHAQTWISGVVCTVYISFTVSVKKITLFNITITLTKICSVH